jgi:hypothetical protein
METASRLGGNAWLNFYTIRALELVCVGGWTAALLWDSTTALLDRPPGPLARAPVRHLLVLLTLSIVLVSATDLTFELAGRSAVEEYLRHQMITPAAWVTNSLLLFCTFAVAFALTGRWVAALVAVGPAYLGFVAVSMLKLRYMHSTLQPLDLLRIPELLPFLTKFFGHWVTVGVPCAVLLWVAGLWRAGKTSSSQASTKLRWTTGIICSILPVSLAAALSAVPYPASNPLLGSIGAPDGFWREQARNSGVLLSFMSELGQSIVPKPVGYSREAVRRVAARYAPASSELEPRFTRANLIVYLIESLMDPIDLGYRYTSDPIPFLHSLGAGLGRAHGLVPEEFGGSANTEFELLTGMSMCFLPAGSLPFRQYLEREVPSLPRVLRQWGYRTTAVQVDPRAFYDRERAYALLGFERTIWLDETPGISRAPQGRSPSDRSVVSAVMRSAPTDKPYFVFAFPSTTHSPYNTGVFTQSSLAAFAPSGAAAPPEVTEYVNALRVADDAVRLLVDSLTHRRQPTILLVLGDHLPPLSTQSLQFFTRKDQKSAPEESARMRRRVPLAIWTNIPFPTTDSDISVSHLPAMVLEAMGAPLNPLMGATAAVRRQLPALGAAGSGCLPGNRASGDVRPAPAQLLDYHLLQYDLLLGHQYAWDFIAPTATAATHRDRTGHLDDALH